LSLPFSINERVSEDSFFSPESIQILLNLRKGEYVSNSQFDTILPQRVRQFSGKHWTPVSVAIRAAELLVTSSRTRILDVGSGPGKFCLIGALTTEGSFVGVEQRKFLVEMSQRAAKALSIPRVSFIHDDMADIEWKNYDGFYLYNPFYENIKIWAETDQVIVDGDMAFAYYVKVVEEKLIRLKPGSRVVTYHGFGGTFPRDFRRVVQEPCGGDFLELWIKEPDKSIQNHVFTDSLIETRYRDY
jgi:SAM-dependent methyltransferase